MKLVMHVAGVAVVFVAAGLAGCDRSSQGSLQLAQYGVSEAGVPNPMPGSPIADAGIAPAPTVNPMPTPTINPSPSPTTVPSTPTTPTTPSNPGTSPGTGAPGNPGTPGTPGTPGR